MKFFFALLGVALAVQASWRQDRLLNWKTQTEYRFKYEASLASGLALPNSLSAITRHRSDVTLQILDDKMAIIQLKNIEFANDNAELPESTQFVPMERVKPQELTTEHKDKMEMPVRFRFEQGLAKELQFHPEDSTWSKNVKRSIISMLQLNWEEISVDRFDRDEYENVNSNNFKTFMEKNVEGNCEVAYNLVSEKKDKITVTKSVNFDNCDERMELTYNYRFTAECPECEYKKIAPQTVYKYEIEKDELKEIELNSVYSVALKDQTLIRTKIQARLSLEETSDIRREIPTHKGPKEEIIYNKEFDYAVEEYLKKGDEAKVNPMEAIPKKVAVIEEIVYKLSQLKEEMPIESADNFMRLVQYIRTCSEGELKEIHDKIYKRSDKKIQSLIEHSLAVSGSKNTIQHLLRHSHHLSTPRLVQLLKSIQETPFPSEQIAEILRDFIKSQRCEDSAVVKQAAWLAYGAIVRGAVGKTVTEIHAFPASEGFKSRASKIMKEQFERADTIYEKVLALKTMANSGLEDNASLLEKIIKDKKEPTVVRMEAIEALRHLAEQLPRRVQRILMPIYSSRMEKNEIRMAALRQLVQAKPALPELSQIVIRMEREPNQHVAAYTYHLLSSLMESPLPAHRNISKLASNLLRTSQYRPEPRMLSIVKHWSIYSQDSLSGLSLQLGSLIGKDSMIPKDMMVALETLFGGNWNKQLAQIGFSQQNVEALFNKVISRLSKWEKKESISRASRVSLKKSVVVLKDLARQLNIRVRESTTEEPFAMLYFRYKQMDYALLPLDNQYLDELIENYVREGSFDLKKVERIFNFDSESEFVTAGFFMDSMMKITNSLGLPMVFYNKMPTVFGLTGKMTIQKVHYGIKARVQAKPSFASLYFHSMHVWVPSFTNGFKNLRTAEVTLPIDIEVEMTYKKELEVKITTQMPENEKSLIRLHSRPVCFVRYFKKNNDIFYGYKETTIRVPSIDRMNQDMSKKFEIQGLEFVLSGSNYRLWNLEALLLGEHHLDLSVIPSRRLPKEMSVKMTFGEIETASIRAPKVEKMLRKEMETEEGEWESRSESSRVEHLNKIVRNMQLDRAYSHLIKVELRGQETSEVSLRTECEGKLKFCRLVAELKPEGRRQWNIKSELEVVLPLPVETVQQLKDQKHREVQILMETKWGTEETNTIEVLAQLEQSRDQRNLVKKHTELRGLPAYEQLIRLARLNQLKAKINYQLSRENQKTFEQLFDVVKGYTYWSSEVKMAENREGELVVKMTSEPMVPGLFNLTVETPETYFRAQQVRLPLVVLPSIVRQPKNMIRHTKWEKSECRIEGDRVNSFDDVIFRAPMSSCYTVVAKDCSVEPRYAVLVKNTKRSGDEKMVKIVFEESEMELEIVDEKLKVNGKSLRPSELEENRIEKIGDHYVIDLDEVVIRFDGYDVKVLLSNGQMETQCGLCGHFDGEKRNDYRTAGDEETDDIEVFHRSFVVKSNECSYESPKGKKAYREYNDYTSEEEESRSSEWSEKKYKKSYSKKSNSRSEEYGDTEEPEEKTLIQEHSHRLCFSLKPVPRCPKNTTPEKTSHKKVEFGCLPRHDTRARKWAQAIRQGKSVDIDIKKNFSDTITVPTICVA